MRISKKLLKHANIAEITSTANDPRPHATIVIANQQLVGLLDSGASISCLGKNAENTILQLGLRMKKVNTIVNTADGAGQSVIGYVDATITYDNLTKIIRLYIIPSLSQQLYLGVDFWQAFRICPAIIGEIDDTPLIENKNKHELDPRQSEELSAIRQLFPVSKSGELGKTSLISHHIEVESSRPIKQRHYPVSPAIQKLMFTELDRMIELGVIEESCSPWSSPIVLVRKSNGKSRLCLDSRALNNVTVKDAYPMPKIDGIMSRLADTYFISSIDLKDAFWQIELDDGSREMTAFTVPGRPLYQFRRMPFGLCNAAQTMCRLMDKVVPSKFREHVFVFIDDLLIVSADFPTHINCLKSVAECLRTAGLTINVDKSHFCMKEIKYLGYIVGNGCIKTDPEKVCAIKEFPEPKTVKQVRSFLGMCGWYQRFIPNYAAIAAPVTDRLKKGRFVWTEEARQGFEKLKLSLVSAPVLSHPDFSRPFVIQCDASATGVGSVLYQVTDEGDEHPIAYMSKKLNSAQRNYCVTELECLAAVLSVKKFRAYVEGMVFKIVTDHSSLKWLMTQKELSGRLARWSLKLQGFNFTIEHRKGSANVVPDALSRAHIDEITNPVAESVIIDLDSPHFTSAKYTALKNTVISSNKCLPDLEVREPHLFLRSFGGGRDRLLTTSTWKLWLPEELQDDAIRQAHDPPLSSHRGIAKTIDRLRQNLYWPQMAVKVREYVSNCDTCKEVKSPNVTLRPRMGRQIEVEMPWQRIYIDLLGPYPRSPAGNTTILIVMDKFSKYSLLKPLSKATAGSIVKFLVNEIFHVYGVPEAILSDNGVQFRSKEFTACLQSFGISHVRTATHSPQVNASERVNRSVLAAIRAYLRTDQRDWDKNLSAIGCALRSAVHDSTGYSPHYLVFGQQIVQHASTYALLRKLGALPTDQMEILPEPEFRILIKENVKDNLRRAYETNERTYNTRTRDVAFRPGQEVFRRAFTQSNFAQNFNAKLGKQWIKCRIRERQGTCNYLLEDMQGKSIPIAYHAKDLRSS